MKMPVTTLEQKQKKNRNRKNINIGINNKSDTNIYIARREWEEKI